MEDEPEENELVGEARRLPLICRNLEGLRKVLPVAYRGEPGRNLV